MSTVRSTARARLLTLLLCVAACAASGHVTVAAQHRSPSVLMLFAMTPASPAVTAAQGAFQRRLVERLGEPVAFSAEYLDLGAEADDAYQRSLAGFLAQKYAGRHFDLVLAHRTETLGFLERHGGTLLPNVPVVFTEVFERDLGQVSIPENATGAFVEDTAGTTPVALELLPDTRHFVVIAGATSIERQMADWATQHLKRTFPAFDVERLDGQPEEAQRARLATLPPHTIALFVSYRADASGHPTNALDVLQRLSRASNAPIFGISEPHLGAGIVGGELSRLDLMAERAADLAVRVLKGEPAGSIPWDRRPATVVAFDARQLARWGIAESALPAGSEVRFREPSLWNDYKWQVIGSGGLVTGQALLIGGLFAERRRRRRAQAGLVEAEHRYRTVADRGADWEYWRLPDGAFRYVSPACTDITGYSPEEFAARPDLMHEIVLDEDRDAWERHRASMRRSSGRGAMEFRIRTRDGQVRWIEHVCAPVTGPDGADQGRRGSNRDATARKSTEASLQTALAEIKELRDRLEVDNTYLRDQLERANDIEGILGASDAMRAVNARVQLVAPTASSVLLLGETGVGKSLLAQAIHRLSPRRSRPLVTLNCAAMAPTLIEAELFGHEKGAFTGAQARRLGRLEIADGGTLFLDEVAELSLDLQAKLLLAVQDGTFERLGSSVARKVDVRIIAATNRNLEQEVRAGRFRQDLLYRLNVFPITVPPLRQRPEDIPLLVQHFLAKHARELHMAAPVVSKATMRTLQARKWPGNIRELENVVERAVITGQGLRFEIAEDDGHGSTADAAPRIDGTLDEVERAHIVATLDRLGWRIEGAGGAADVLGINASTLRGRMRKHGISRPVVRAPGLGRSA